MNWKDYDVKLINSMSSYWLAVSYEYEMGSDAKGNPLIFKGLTEVPAFMNVDGEWRVLYTGETLEETLGSVKITHMVELLENPNK